MASEIEAYKAEIEETLRKFDCKLPLASYGISYHRVYVDGSGIASDYELSETNEKFIEITGINASQINSLRYESIFPETKEIKFDWVAAIGQVGISDGRTKFYCYSETFRKWFLILAFSPKKGYTFLIFEDITNAKALEIQKNINKSKSSVLEG